MEVRKVRFTLGADEFEWAKDLGIILFEGEAPVLILGVQGCNDNVLRDFNEVLVITTFWADNAI